MKNSGKNTADVKTTINDSICVCPLITSSGRTSATLLFCGSRLAAIFFVLATFWCHLCVIKVPTQPNGVRLRLSKNTMSQFWKPVHLFSDEHTSFKLFKNVALLCAWERIEYQAKIHLFHRLAWEKIWFYAVLNWRRENILVWNEDWKIL